MATKPEHLTIATWNAGWASPKGNKGRHIRTALADRKADVIVLTEGHRSLLPDDGDLVEADGHWGYEPERAGSRKVLMWSKHQWTDVDRIGCDQLPQGRWVSATTNTDLGPVRVVGVCIPWKNAMLTKGTGASQWSEHKRFLCEMPCLLRPMPTPLIVTGDFNQRMPKKSQPQEVFDLLTTALAGLTTPTEGPHHETTLIDHIAVKGLAPVEGSLAILPGVVKDKEITDHTGVVLDLQRPRP